jgi:signal transduction histidine kinase
MLLAASIALVFVLAREIRRGDAAERNDRHKSGYLAMVSDELRTPLHSILDNVDSLQLASGVDAGAAQNVQSIAIASNRLRSVVDRMLDYLHIEARLPVPRMGRIMLERLFDECCIIVESDAAAKRLNLRYGFKAGTPEQFVTDGDLLREILLNLLTNAVKFTERGEVTIEVGGTTERITIEVTDTGCGISPAMRHRLFRHDELPGAVPAAVAGYGIGLALSRRLVKALNGNIGFRENPAGGSIFWIGLPAGTLPELTSYPVRAPLQMVLP